MIEWRDLDRNAASARTPNAFEWREAPVASVHHERLGVGPGASREEIRQAYRRLAVLCHPDRQPEAARTHAEERMKQLNHAYQVLSRPASHDD